MKLNKKGLTIIELIVSIALISVIMLFMYKLLSDITFERDNDYIATLNHEQRIEIIDNIESVLNDNNAGITSYSATGKTLRITYNGSINYSSTNFNNFYGARAVIEINK